ncbi:MAG: hypothetical protein ACSHYF_11865 [Verrucomicrobiaceae bacterium]
MNSRAYAIAHILVLGLFAPVSAFPPDLSENNVGLYTHIKRLIEKHDTIVDIVHLEGEFTPAKNDEKNLYISRGIVSRVHKGKIKVGERVEVRSSPPKDPTNGEAVRITVLFFDNASTQVIEDTRILDHVKWGSIDRLSSDPFSSVYRKAFDYYSKTDISKN